MKFILNIFSHIALSAAALIIVATYVPGIDLQGIPTAIAVTFALFVIRLDAAYPLYDPALDGPFAEEYKTYYDALDFEIPAKKVALNIAIGYPF